MTDLKRAIRKNSMDAARWLVGSRRTRRFAWAQWSAVRLRAATGWRPIYRRMNVEWDVPGHARAVTSEIPGPGPDEVLVRTVVSAISPGTERSNFRLEANTAGGYPMLPGYSLAGEVVEVGKEVTHLRAGDLVATQAPHASAVVRPARLAFPVPPGVSAAEASFIFLGMIVLHGLLRCGVAPEDRVIVIGRGTIGLLAVQLAHALGAEQVVSVAPSARRITPGLDRFADRIVATGDAGEQALGGLEATIVVEASGAPDAMAAARRLCVDGGRIALLGSPRVAAQNVDFGAFADRSIELVGAHVSTLTDPPGPGRHGYGEVARMFLTFLGERRIDVLDLVGAEIDPWECGRFYRDLGRSRPEWAAALFRWDRVPEAERLEPRHPWSPPDLELARGMTMTTWPMSRLAGGGRR